MDEVAKAMRKVKSLEKLTKAELKATAITSLGKKTALELVLAAAEENKANANDFSPKVIRLHRADEQPTAMKQAVGQTVIDFYRPMC